MSDEIIQLSDGRHLLTTWHTYPVAQAEQATLISLWQSEWTKTDFDWLPALNGAYSETLRIDSLVGTIEGVPVATATVLFPGNDPEVSVISSVITLPAYRRLGIAAQLTDRAAIRSFSAGCQVCYLGGTSVYCRCGFDWYAGVIMRRAAPQAGECESHFFAPGQSTSVREAQWGDLPGTACLIAQRPDCLVIDYPRGLISGKYSAELRCVSNFPLLWDDATNHGGTVCVLAGEAAHRVLGVGTLTPGAGNSRRHVAVVDLFAHDHYATDASRILEYLIGQAVKRDVESLQAYVAVDDRNKMAWFEQARFKPVTTLTGQLRIEDRPIDVKILQRQTQ